jgi:hypothetical protein
LVDQLYSFTTNPTARQALQNARGALVGKLTP